MNNKNFYIILLLTFTLFGCEEEVTLDLPKGEQEYVIEGHIENGAFPYVFITKDAPYFSSVDTSDINKLLVSGAEVTVYDGDTTVTLTEIRKGVYLNFSMLGKLDTYYDLKVTINDTTLTARTYVPNPVPQFDTIWAETKEGYEDVFRIWIKHSDPDTLGNYIRIFTRINSDEFLSYSFSVFDDSFINGLTYDDIIRNGEVESCYNDDPDADTTKLSLDFEECGLFKLGDTVTVKFSSMDQAHFDFWRTIEHESHNSGSPFSSPTIIQGNIEGGLGIWGGYGSMTKTIIIE
ncbi:MAG: DUF4249 domain-containing protein [Bacteroidia bacterium]|nr:DUF4249 domain-containing protein [Bacteroidia bacterium]